MLSWQMQPQSQVALIDGSRAAMALGSCFSYCAIVFYGIAGYLCTASQIGENPRWRGMNRGPQDFGLTGDVVSLHSTDGISLKGWWLQSQGPVRANVIIAHGVDHTRQVMLPSFVPGSRWSTMCWLLICGDTVKARRSMLHPAISNHVMFSVRYSMFTSGVSTTYSSPRSFLRSGCSRTYGGAIGRRCSSDRRRRISKWGGRIREHQPRHRQQFRDEPRFARRRLHRMLSRHTYCGCVGLLRSHRYLAWTRPRQCGFVCCPNPRSDSLHIRNARLDCTHRSGTRVMAAVPSPLKSLITIPDAQHDTTFSTAPALYQGAVLKFLDSSLPKQREH